MLEMIEYVQPDTWSEVITLACYALGDYSRAGTMTSQRLLELIRSSPFSSVLHAREPLQYYLRSQGIPPILDWQMVEQLRTGRAGWEMELFAKETPLLEKDRLFQAVRYLWPGTHVIHWLWRCLI